MVCILHDQGAFVTAPEKRVLGQDLAFLFWPEEEVNNSTDKKEEG
jgi:hypothetical protein